MLKITKSLVDNGIFACVTILARWEEGLSASEQIDSNRQVWRIPCLLSLKRLPVVGRPLEIVQWLLLCLWRVRRLPVTCVNCHSLVVLPFGVILKAWRGCDLVYDTHELETETSRSRGIRKKLAKWMERRLIGWADRVVVVGDDLGQWYQEQYHLDVHVVRNLPYSRQSREHRPNVLREYCGLRDQDELYIYHGALTPGRGVELLLRVFSRMPDHKHIVLMGFGTLVDDIKKAADANANIHFHPAVPPQDLAGYTASADVGLSLIENVSLSYYYCLPNKVFEYLNCGLPIVVSDFPAMARLVDQWHCGWKVTIDEERVVELIRNLNPADIAARTAAVDRCAAELNWENEEPALVDVYRGIAA